MIEGLLGSEAIAGGGWLVGLQLLYALFIGHILGDYPLQNTFLALGKNRRHQQALRESADAPKEGTVESWLYCLFAHSAIHSGIVWLITGSFVLALVELVFHGLIDWAKSEGRFNLAVDQSLHVLCKLFYVFLLLGGVV